MAQDHDALRLAVEALENSVSFRWRIQSKATHSSLQLHRASNLVDEFSFAFYLDLDPPPVDAFYFDAAPQRLILLRFY